MEYISRERARALVRAYDGPLDPLLRETLLAIADHYPDPFPSYERLGLMLGVSPSAVQRRLRRLDELWLLETHRAGRRETSRAHRRILLPGFPLPTKARVPKPVRRCGRCQAEIEHLRADARWCSQACRKVPRVGA